MNDNNINTNIKDNVNKSNGNNENNENNENNSNDSDDEVIEEEIMTEDIINQIQKRPRKKSRGSKDSSEKKYDNDVNTSNDLNNFTTTEEENELNLSNSNNDSNVFSLLDFLKIFFFDFYTITNKNILEKMRLITLIILILYFLIGLASLCVYIYDDSHLTLFCFKFMDRNAEKQIQKNYDTIYFLTDINSFNIIHLLLLFIFISVGYTLKKNNFLEIKFFFKNTSIYFPITLILNIPIFIIGIFINDKYYDYLWRPVIFLIITFFGTFFMAKIYFNVKRLKYKTTSNLINVSILTSIFTAFECYCFIYCVAYLYSYLVKNKSMEEIGMEIIAGAIYFAIGFYITVSFKDIFFPFAMVVIEIGLLYIKKSNSLATVAFNLIFVFLNFASIILTIFKYKKNVFRLIKID